LTADRPRSARRDPGASLDSRDPIRDRSGATDARHEPPTSLSAGESDPLAGIDLEAAAGELGTWLELSVAADHEAVEAVSEILTRAAPGGTSVEPAFELVDEGLAARVDLARPALVRAHLPLLDAAVARTATLQASQALGHLQAFGLRPIGDLEARLVHEADWANAWKAHFPVMRVGRRIVIRPSWRRHRRRPGDVVLALDPGMAFGTGLHPTTRLCLAAIEALADDGRLSAVGIDVGAGPGGRAGSGPGPRAGSGPGPRAVADLGPGGRRATRVLDVGCGSGILAIAAARLGAGAVLAVDVDPIAIEATHGNARRNRLGRVVRAREGSAPSGEGPFDVVLANLIASLLVTLADGLVADVRRGGTLLASGIFADREPEVIDAFEKRGLTLARRWTEGDWVALELRRLA
jgi:ribosomal protein L11 methyltransferase